MDSISLFEPEQSDAGTISLTPDTPVVQYPNQYIDTRVNRYHVALGQNSPGTDVLRNDVTNGDTGQWDQLIARAKDVSTSEARAKLVQDWAATRDPFTPISGSEQAVIEGLTSNNFPKANPAIAMNEGVAEQYMNVVNSVSANRGLAGSAAVDPQGTMDVVDAAQIGATRTMIAQDVYQQVVKSRENESLLETGTSFLKSLIPGYSSIISNDTVKGAKPVTVLDGNNWKEQISYLYSLPPDQFQEKLQEAVDEIRTHDPMLAETFAKAVVSFSTSDQGAMNIGVLGNFALGGIASKAGKVEQLGSKVLGKAGQVLRRGAVEAEAEAPGIAGRAAQGVDDSRIPRPSPEAPSPEVARTPEVPAAGRTHTREDLEYQLNVQSSKDALKAGENLADRVDAALSRGDKVYIYPNGVKTEIDGVGKAHLRDTNDKTYNIDDIFGNKAPTDPTLTIESGRGTTGLAHRATSEFDQGMKRVAAEAAEDPTNLPKIAGRLGMNEIAAKTEMQANIAAGDATGISLAKADPSIESRLPSGMAPARGFTAQSDLSAASKAKIQETALKVNAIEKALQTDFIQRVTRVDRLEPNQLSIGANEAFDKIKEIFQSVNHNIMDYEVGRTIHPAEEDKLTNLYQVSVRFGQRDGTLFSTKQAAENFVKRNISPRTNDYTIKSDGLGGYFAEVRRNVSEVGDVRNIDIPTEYRTPDAFWNQVGSYLRSADYQLPQSNVVARGRVLHGEEYGAQLLRELAEPIGRLSKAEKSGLEKVLESERRNRSFARTDLDFGSEYMARNGHLPTTAQAEAHRAIVDLHDVDYVVRDADVVMQKSRQGGERFSFKLDVNGEPGFKEFDGVEKTSLPFESKDPFFVQVVDNGRAGRRFYSKVIFDKERKAINDAIANNYRIVLNPSESTYYLVKEFKRDRIPLGTLGFEDGGHDIYRFSDYIKQGDVSSVAQGAGANPVRYYRGDTSLASAPTAKHAQEITKLLNQGREMLLRNDPNVASWWANKLDDFMTLPEFQKAVAKGTVKLDVPFVATKAGQRTVDVSDWSKGIEHFVDGTQNEHNVFGNVTGRFIGEKSPIRLDVLEAEGNRVVKTTHEALLNPWDTMRQATQNLLDTRVANDYRQKIGADWVQEFGHLFEGDLNKLYANPLDTLNNVSYKTGADPLQVRAAENVRLRTLELNNYRTLWDRQVEQYKSKFVDAAYEKLGPNARDFLNDTLIPKISRPDIFLKSMGYHFKMGLFNPKQLFTQASEILKIAMVSPVHGPQAARQLIVNRMALLSENDNVLRGLADRFGKLMGVDKQDWLAQIDAFKRSGFSIVAHDQGYLDSVAATQGNGIFGKVLDAGQTPFREGELIARNLAYSTAWREFKQANPGKAIDRYAESAILQRAKDLTNNMGRDSAAAWQRGNVGIVTQFFGYHARFMEQMWDGGIFSSGRKLSAAEKWRTIFGMSALYGVPMGATGVVGVIPVKEVIKDWMAQTGQLQDKDETAPNAFLDGILPVMIHSMTGSNVDLSNSFGPSGIPTFYELYNNDKTWTEILAGASGGILADTAMKALGGTANVIADLADIDTEKGSFKLLANDLLEPLQNITTVDSTVKLWQIMNTQKWIAKSGSQLANDATVNEALANMFLGVTPGRISDAFSKIRANKQVQAAQVAGQQEIRSLIQKGSQAANQGDIQAAQIYYKRARAAAVRNGLTPKQMNQAISQGFSNVPITDVGDQVYTRFKQRNLQYRAAPQQ